MPATNGTFVWYELMTEDTAAATAFYRAVAGWGAVDSPLVGSIYTIFTAGDVGVAGVMAIEDEARAMGARPAWIGYIGVENVDTAAAGLAGAGGAVLRPAADIPGVGRFAVVTDPGGAVFCLFTAQTQMPGQPAAGDKPGHIGWRELRAADQAAAFSFYAGRFGWTKAQAIDMGPMGVYQMFAVDGTTMGGMMTKPAEIPMPHWLFYINVDAIDAAAARIAAAGGQVIHGPEQVPGGSWILNGLDPQGALFALVAPVR